MEKLKTFFRFGVGIVEVSLLKICPVMQCCTLRLSLPVEGIVAS